MNFRFTAATAAILAASLVGSYGYAAAPQAPAKKHPTRRAKTPPKPTVEDQINALRQEFQGQIDGLKTDLATKDSELKQAQQAAIARLQAAGLAPVQQHPYWEATGAVTYRDPDGREVVFAPFVFGVNEPDESSTSGKHEFPSA